MIYFIQAGDKAIKIGLAERIKTRFDTLQLANYERLKVIQLFKGDEELEKELHNMAKKYHIRGEWFDKKVLKNTKVMKLVNSREKIEIKLLIKVKRKHYKREKLNINIKELRKKRKWTLEYVANKIGVTARTAYRWESGESVPLRIFQRKLDKILKMVIK